MNGGTTEGPPHRESATESRHLLPNVVMFVPLGFLLPLLSHRLTRGSTVVACALASLGIELAQLLQYIALGHGRAVDINDLIANTLGGLLGYAALRTAQGTASTRAVLNKVSPSPSTV
ncbi:VanZ family protein [Streptomyces erythrochromogenes]|uniref:VanZ family protein n=1 Tax=Streptomyces erythrochromogenes TaxID=285574 RepID=UPI0037D75D8D